MIQVAEHVQTVSSVSQAAVSHGHTAFQQGEAVLRSSSHPSLRRLSCEYHLGVLTIRGRVPTYYIKQIAQSLLGKLEGVEEINNLIEVRYTEVLTRPRQ